jgi:hypothetical protein
MMVMTLIYVVYYDDRHIPRFIALVRHRHFIQNRSDVTFARLHVTKRSGEGEGDDTSVIDDGEVDLHFTNNSNSQQQLNQSFNNPMFDENIIIHQQNTNNNEHEKVNNEVVEEEKKKA